MWSYIVFLLDSHLVLWTSRLEWQNTLTTSLQRSNTPQMSVLDMTLKQSDGEVPVIQKLWEIMCRTSLLPLFPGSL